MNALPSFRGGGGIYTYTDVIYRVRSFSGSLNRIWPRLNNKLVRKKLLRLKLIGKNFYVKSPQTSSEYSSEVLDMLDEELP